jgi:hypothetical protein
MREAFQYRRLLRGLALARSLAGARTAAASRLALSGGSIAIQRIFMYTLIYVVRIKVYIKIR